MNEDNIRSLKEALAVSPDNIPIRYLLAEAYVQGGRFPEAEQEYKTILERNNSEVKAQKALANIYYLEEKYSAGALVLQQLAEQGSKDTEVLCLYAKILIKEDDIQSAIEYYQQAIEIDPDIKDEELDAMLRLGGSLQLDGLDELDGLDDKFLEKPKINFGDVGGMTAVKKEIDLKIIKPLEHKDLYAAYGKKAGGGILLYGPPGCGKTFIAKATAGEINAKFINVALNDILDMWIGNSEKNLHDIFQLARENTPCVLFIDEIDALGANRSDMKQSAGRHLINQFLLELDGVKNENDGVLILGATNTPWHLDPAFRRPGRFDRIIFVPPPDEESRSEILKLKLESKPTGSIEYDRIAKKLNKFSGADIDALIDIAIEQKLESAFEDGIPKPLVTGDLISAAKKHQPSTQEWFTTAKNFALFANDSGLYDDILDYLKIKK